MKWFINETHTGIDGNARFEILDEDGFLIAKALLERHAREIVRAHNKMVANI